MSSEVVRARVVVRGRVQGVWFRQSTLREAVSLGVSGWVRNLPDGSVEAVFEGGAGAVHAAVEYVRTGPPRAQVDHAEVVWEHPEGETGFRVTA